MRTTSPIRLQGTEAARRALAARGIAVASKAPPAPQYASETERRFYADLAVRRAVMADDRAAAASMRATLTRLFPLCFTYGDGKSPLKIGIKDDIRVAQPQLDGWFVALALRDYTSGYHYHKAVALGAVRVGLDGKPAGEVNERAAGHAKHEIKEFARREASRRKR